VHLYRFSSTRHSVVEMARNTGVWRTGMSILPAAPPIKYVLGYRSRTRTRTLTLTLAKEKQNDTGIKFNIELYLKVNLLRQGVGL